MEKLYFKYKDNLKNYGLVLESDSKEKIVKFTNLCKVTLSKNLNWFHQGNCENFQFFEFWSNDLELMLEESLRIAKEMEISLEIKK